MKLVISLITIFSVLISRPSQAQEIEIITHGMTKYEPVGTLELIIYFEVVNISPFEQTIFEVRTINDVPANWSSSLCFGELCFAPNVDSVATTPDFLTDPLQPNDTLETSIHVFTDQASIGTAHVQIEVGTFRNPDIRYPLDFTLTTDPTVGVNEANLANTYQLFQNYPNPFNPSTRINYNVEEPGLVQVKVYNVLGVEVATLVNEYKTSGNYFTDFNASAYSSGVYFYSMSVNGFNQTRKMILEK